MALLLFATGLASTAKPKPKPVVYWKGDLLATNATAASSVRGRGFTHACGMPAKPVAC